jgi:hypothetical protein
VTCHLRLLLLMCSLSGDDSARASGQRRLPRGGGTGAATARVCKAGIADASEAHAGSFGHV